MIKVTYGKGVLSKDGVTPFAAGTLHYTTKSYREEWKMGDEVIREAGPSEMMSPADFTYMNIARIFEGMMLRDDVVEMQLIDPDNNQVTIRRTGPGPTMREEIRQYLTAIRNAMSRAIAKGGATEDEVQRRDKLTEWISALK